MQRFLGFGGSGGGSGILGLHELIDAGVV